MEKREWLRKASSGEGQIYSVIYSGTEKRALLHLIHGMSEHSGRYEDFAAFLVDHGFVVVMEDHQGHGRSARVPGHFGDHNGWKNILKDLKGLSDEARKQYPDLPFFLMGHSMGSFLARSYVIRYGKELDGLILSGTMGRNPAVYVGLILAAVQKKLKGPKSKAKLLYRLGMGNYNKEIRNPVNSSAWLSTVDEVCRAYEADPLSGVEFTAAAYYDLFSGLKEINSAGWAQKVPDLPIYLFAGGADPVGNYGKGPAEVYALLKESGHQTELKIYPGYRHEMLNEAIHEQVYQDIMNWLERQLEHIEKKQKAEKT